MQLKPFQQYSIILPKYIVLVFLNQLCLKIANVWPIAELPTSLRIFVFWKKLGVKKYFATLGLIAM